MDAKTNQFKAEISEMLDLVVNSLYSKKEIFLRELISNASDAIDRAKFLSLTDKALAEDNPEWTIKIVVDKSQHTLMISDNGIGIAPEHQDKVFERFYRVDKSHSKQSGGTGLGLSIVRQMVQLHGGDIAVVSEPGVGSVFSVTIPIRKGDA